MRLAKRVSAVLLSVAMLGSLPVSAKPTEQESTADAATTPPSGLYETVHTTDDYILFADTVTGDFVLRDRAGGCDWYSAPSDIKEDKITKGVNKTNMRSMLVVHYIEAATLTSAPTELTINSYIGSVMNEDLTVDLTDDGFCVRYRFTEEGFTIPVRVSLKADGLHVRICVTEIQNESGNCLTRFDLLPGLMAAGVTQTQGALFVPSGSGALVDFSSHNGQYGTYSEQLYGEDAAIGKEEENTPTQGVRVPVYGIMKQDGALAAIITEGDSSAAILADGIGPTMGYNRVYSQYILSAVDSTKLFEADYFNLRVIYAAENRRNLADYEVCYTPLNGKNNSLGGIATAYREYLLTKGVTAKAAKPQLNVTLYGAGTRKASFLGIPYEKTFAMTTFDEAAQIVTDLHEAGVPTALRYEGWNNTGLQNKKVPTSVSPVKALGGNKKYQKLLTALQEMQTEAYFDVDFCSVRRSGHGISILSDTIKNMFNTRSQQYRFMLSTGVPVLTESPWYMLRSTEIPVVAGKLAAKLKNTPGISLNGFGESLYSDFYKKSSLSRLDCEKAYQKAADAFEDTALAVTGGNAYTYAYADRIYALPQSHNGHLLLDESVPFVQMVLHGLIPYSSEPFNRSTDPRASLLDSIAFGSDPYYIGMAIDGAELIETNFVSLYSTDYDTWSKQAAEVFHAYESVYATLYDRTIMDYTVTDGVSKTVFDDGTRILVNRTASPVTLDGTAVEGMGYAVLH